MGAPMSRNENTHNSVGNLSTEVRVTFTPSQHDSGLRDAGEHPELQLETWQRDVIKSSLFGTPLDVAKIGRFSILGQVGKGGMGVVYAAYDDQLERKVAVKVLRPCERSDPQQSIQMLHEARAMARLNHPNNVIVHEVGHHAGEVFIAMEFVRGMNFHEWLRTARPWREVVSKFIEAGRGLAAAHAAGIVHRDFKPQNVMITRSGLVKVMDFGLANFFAAPTVHDSELISLRRVQQQAPQTGKIAGTPAYMAPEQIRGQTTDARSDQFSFCVALHEALYGYRPFHGKNVVMLFESVLHDHLDPEPPAHTSVPTWIYDVIVRGLARDPTKRWPNMHALLEALANDPATTLRQRTLWTVGPLACLGIAALFAGTNITPQTPLETCRNQAQQEIHEVWSPRHRGELERAARLEPGRSYARQASAHLDRFSDAWQAMRTDTCVAHAQQTQSDYLFDLRMACLGHAKDKASAAVEHMLWVGAPGLDTAFDAVANFSDIQACGDVSALLAEIPPPRDPAVAVQVKGIRRELATIEALIGAAEYVRADARLHPLQARAEQLHYSPVTAEVWLMSGQSALMQTQAQLATDSLERARRLALETGSDQVLVKALAMLMYVHSELDRNTERAAGYADHLLAIMPRLHLASDVRWLVENNLAIYYERLGDPARAQARYHHAIEARAQHQDLLLARTYLNLSALLLGQSQHRQALEYAERACDISVAYTTPLHPATLPFRQHLAYALEQSGFADEAREELKTLVAAATKTGRRRTVVSAVGLRMLADLELGRAPTAAARDARESLDILRELNLEASQFAVATHHTLGDSLLAEDPDRALAHHRRAVVLAQDFVEEPELAYHRRRLDRAQAAAL